MNSVRSCVNGTVGIISVDFFIYGLHVRFTMKVPLTTFMIKNEWDIHAFNFKSGLFSILVYLLNLLENLCFSNSGGNCRN